MSTKPVDCGCLSLVSEGGISGRHPAVDLTTVHVGPATAAEFNTVRAGLVPVACWRVEDLRFEFDSSFVTPEINAELEHLALLMKDHPPISKSGGKPGCPLSVFGHADPVGNDDYNKQLSGRRATAIYALLTRDINLWEKLFSQPFGNDKWGRKFLVTMLDTVSPAPEGKTNQEQAIQHERDAGKRKELYKQYMEKLCGPDLKLKKEDFLGHGDDVGRKGDFQGCSEFNPVLIFSQEDQNKFEQDKDKTARDNANAPNRRVMVLIFRKGSRVDPAKWPCPRAKEGVAGCKKRFWSDGEDRRNRRLPTDRRKHEETHDTFACRFYDRLANTSPCERLFKHHTFYYGLQMGINMPWSESASLSFKSEDGAHIRTFSVSQATEVGCYRVIAFPDWRPGVRYKGEVKEGNRTIQLFDYCELTTAQQTSEGLSLLVSPASDSNRSQESIAEETNTVYLPSEGFQAAPASSEEEREASRRAAEPYKGVATPY